MDLKLEICLAGERPFLLGGVEVRPANREVVAGARRELIEPKVMQVLVVLAKHCGEVVSKDELIAACWGGRVVVDEAVRRCILEIRRLAQRHGGFSVTTVHRVGYRLDEGRAEHLTPVGARREPEPFALARSAPLVGRDRELGQLRQLLSDCIATRGGMALFAGEPGIGKTRLSQEIGKLAVERGALVLEGRCYASASPNPYGAFVEILDEFIRSSDDDAIDAVLVRDAPTIALLLPEMAERARRIAPSSAAPTQPQPRQLSNSLADVIGRMAAKSPLVLILDDLHWADAVTAGALRQLARRLSQRRILILGTYRDEEHEMGQPFADLLEELLRQRACEHIALRGLSPEDTASMVVALAGRGFAPRRLVGLDPPETQVAGIHAATRGNPFFIEEVVRQLAQEGRLFDDSGLVSNRISADELGLTDGIKIVIGKRLARLTRQTRDTLAAAAIISYPAPLDLLEAMGAGAPADILEALREAELAGFAANRNGRCQFAHDLIRGAIASGLPDVLRQQMHRRAAEAVERLYPGEVEARAAELGRHLSEGATSESAERSIEYLMTAGFQALKEASPEVADRHFSSALQRADGVEPGMRARLLCGKARSLGGLGRMSDAVASFGQALALYAQAGDPKSLLDMTVEYAEWLALAECHGEAVEVCQKALARNDLDPATGAHLLSSLGYNAWMSGQDSLGESTFRQAQAALDALGDERLSTVGLTHRALVAYGLGEFKEAAELALEAGRRWRALGDLWMASTIVPTAASALLQLGRWDEAERLVEEIEPITESTANVLGWHLCQQVKAPLNGFRFGALYNEDDCAVFRSKALNEGAVWACELLGVNDYFLGRWNDAISWFEQGLLRSKGLKISSAAWCGLLTTRALKGDRRQADALIEAWRAERQLADGAGHLHIGDWHRVLYVADALFTLGHDDELAALFPVLRSSLEHRAGGGFCGRMFETIVAVSAAAGRQWDLADSHFIAVARQADELPHLMEQADLRLRWAQARLRRSGPGDREAARCLARDAADRFARLKMVGHHELAASIVRRL